MADYLKTQFLAPEWWVTASVETGLMTLLPNPQALSNGQRLVPCLTPNELSSLALILSTFQGQLLDGAQKVKIGFEEHRKCLSLMSNQGAFYFERMIQFLPALGLLSQESVGHTHPAAFFSDNYKDYSDPHSPLELGLGELGMEILLGFVDGFEDVSRYLQDHKCFRDLGFQRPPLNLNRSILLDLHGFDRVLFLRLETAMQWDKGLLNLGGTYGKGIADLFCGIDRPRRKQNRNNLLNELGYLQKLGKKLVDHGVLRIEDDPGYLFFGNRVEAPVVLWSSNPSRAEADNERFLSDCAKIFFARFSQNKGNFFFTRLLEMSGNAGESFAADYWNAVDGMDKVAIFPLVVENQIINPLLLFFEWSMRQYLPEGELSLPPDLAKSTIGWLVSIENSQPVDKRLTDFIKYFQDNRESFYEVAKIKKGMLCSYHNWGQLKFSFKRGSGVEVTNRPPKRKSRHLPPVDFEMTTPKKATRKRNVEEITWLRKHEPEKYAQVRKAFLESLEGSRKQLILDVKKRLKPAVFDEHLTHTLTKFVQENPSVLLLEKDRLVNQGENG